MKERNGYVQKENGRKKLTKLQWSKGLFRRTKNSTPTLLNAKIYILLKWHQNLAQFLRKKQKI